MSQLVLSWRPWNSTQPTFIREVVDLKHDAVSQKGVSFNACHRSVVAGVGVREEGGFGKLSLDVDVIETLKIELLAYDDTGVLLYSPLTQVKIRSYLKFLVTIKLPE